MSFLRFQHIYAMLLGAAFLCAFVLPSRAIDSARLPLSGIFNPLSGPLRRLAVAVGRPFERSDPSLDPATRDLLLRQNDEMRQELARLQANLQRLEKADLEGAQLGGDLKSQCVRVSVAGTDSGGRDTLILSAGSGELEQDAPVLYSGGLAGKLDARFGAARVRLITDEGLSVTGEFIRFVRDSQGIEAKRLNTPPPLVRGLGQGRLAVVGMRWADCADAGLRQGDWVVLDDSDWPAAVQGTRLGRVIVFQESRQDPLFASIWIQPETDLTRLPDVWVLRQHRTEDQQARSDVP